MNFYDESLLKNKKHIHFIGIGGSGMFPIVQILHSEGFYITGSDNNETETIKIERSMGIEIFMGQRAENIKGADLIVYTAAIMADNPELIAALTNHIHELRFNVHTVFHLQNMMVDHSTDTMTPRDEAFPFQFGKNVSQLGAADAEDFRQFGFSGQSVAIRVNSVSHFK